MAKYAYPAVFEPENELYNVFFPNLPECYTCGGSLPEAMEMAADALALALYQREKEKREIPQPGKLQELHTMDGSFASYISCDTLLYQKKYNNRAVKKTLSIPEWLNEAATAAGLNFSQVLQTALKQELHLM